MIALYKGTHLYPSRLTELFTWSQYSHASWICADESEYAAEMDAGVVHLPHWGDTRYHNAGTEIDLYDFVDPLTPEETTALEAFLEKQVGKDYDWAGVFSFIWFMRLLGLHNNELKWFCFELIAAACIEIGRALSRLASWRMAGREFEGSTIIKYIGTIRIPSANKIDTTKPAILLG